VQLIIQAMTRELAMEGWQAIGIDFTGDHGKEWNVTGGPGLGDAPASVDSKSPVAFEITATDSDPKYVRECVSVCVTNGNGLATSNVVTKQRVALP
jgi:hypothetical protein